MNEVKIEEIKTEEVNKEEVNKEEVKTEETTDNSNEILLGLVNEQKKTIELLTKEVSSLKGINMQLALQGGLTTAKPRENAESILNKIF